MRLLGQKLMIIDRACKQLTRTFVELLLPLEIQVVDIRCALESLRVVKYQ